MSFVLLKEKSVIQNGKQVMSLTAVKNTFMQVTAGGLNLPMVIPNRFHAANTSAGNADTFILHIRLYTAWIQEPVFGKIVFTETMNRETGASVPERRTLCSDL